MKTPLFIALMLLAGFAFGVSVSGRTIELTEAESATCEKEGGCVVVTNAFLVGIVNHIENIQKKLNKSCI